VGSENLIKATDKKTSRSLFFDLKFSNKELLKSDLGGSGVRGADECVR
jgi:hypothetical protein